MLSAAIHRALARCAMRPCSSLFVLQRASVAAADVTLSARLLHTSSERLSITGISFSQPPPAELKVAQWMKKQEILSRRRACHQLAERVWAAHPREPWAKLTHARAEQLMQQQMRVDKQLPADAPATAAVMPSEWEVSELFTYTLQQQCPWRADEVARERKAHVDAVIGELYRTLRRESEAHTHGSMQMTQNELTRRLTALLGGKLPSAAEVEAAWQDRHQLPAIEWLEDHI